MSLKGLGAAEREIYRSLMYLKIIRLLEASSSCVLKTGL
jgi:hypothetical protein